MWPEYKRLIWNWRDVTTKHSQAMTEKQHKTEMMRTMMIVIFIAYKLTQAWAYSSSYRSTASWTRAPFSSSPSCTGSFMTSCQHWRFLQMWTTSTVCCFMTYFVITYYRTTSYSITTSYRTLERMYVLYFNPTYLHNYQYIFCYSISRYDLFMLIWLFQKLLFTIIKSDSNILSMKWYKSTKSIVIFFYAWFTKEKLIFGTDKETSCSYTELYSLQFLF